MTRFAGEVAFVTGATSGIGRATALAIARTPVRISFGDTRLAGHL